MGYLRIKEAAGILDYLKLQTADLIKPPSIFSYFGFIALELLKDGKGSAFCKTGHKTYQARELQSVPIGLGKNPLKVSLRMGIWILKRLFSKKKYISGIGGERYLCPEGHELISMITLI